MSPSKAKARALAAAEASAPYVGLLAPVGYAMLLGVVLVDMLIDFSPETAWKEAYYATHRTAPYPQRAFIPLAMALAITGFCANARKEVQAAAAYGVKAAPRDPRNVASGVLGVSIAVIFNRFLLPRQDWVAQVVVEGKARVRLSRQLAEALAVIRRGHVAIAVILAGLVVLQLGVAIDKVVEARVGNGKRAGGTRGDCVSLLDEFGGGGGKEKRNGRAKTPKTL